jgi:hypothetical protein
MEALPLTRLLHDNMATVMTFVFSQAPIRRLIKERFTGYPERLEDFSFEVPVAIIDPIIIYRVEDQSLFGPALD